MDDPGSITAYFITTGGGNDDNGDPSHNLSSALECLKKHLSAERIHELNDNDGFRLLISKDLTKTDVLVFDKFRGEFFKQIQKNKCLVLGAPCLIECLRNGLPIPNGCSPVYNIAMRDLQISISGVKSQQKEAIRQQILWMGGKYFPNFSPSATHLVSNTIKSTKYEYAASSGIPIMHVDWVQRVWERSLLNATITASDPEFDKYSLPIFFGTNITCTGLDSTKKDEIKRLVNENGGTYHRAFKSQIIDIVITEKDKTNTDKFQAAVNYRKDILLPEWIFDSVEKGYALPTMNYEVKSLKISTPTKTGQKPAEFICADSTQVSDISHISTIGVAGGGFHKDPKRVISTTLDYTICSNMNDSAASFASFSVPANTTEKGGHLNKTTAKTVKSKTAYQQVLASICPQKAKRAGNFLDGCEVYLSGFRNEEREKLNRILNTGGATRYDAFNEKVTHVIVGEFNPIESKSWKMNGNSCHIVHLEWLQESIQLRQPANELKHNISLSEFLPPNAPSPSSKKILRSMNHSFMQPESSTVKKQLFAIGQKNNESIDNGVELRQSMSTTTTDGATLHLDNEEEEILMAEYSQKNIQKMPTGKDCAELSLAPLACSTQISRPGPVMENQTDTLIPTQTQNRLMNFFQGMSIYVDKEHFTDDFYSDILSECDAAGGCIVNKNFRDVVDYAIVSLEHTFDTKTLPVKAKNVVTELYVENCLAENKLVPIEYFHKHIPSTADSHPLEDMTIVVSIYTSFERHFIDSLAHLLGANVNKIYTRLKRPLLICPSPEGSKYAGAIKWNYPVVTSEWLMVCANEGKKISFRPYLVGDCCEDFLGAKPAISSNTQSQKGKAAEREEKEKSDAAPPMNNNHLENKFTPLRSKRVAELANTNGFGNFDAPAMCAAASPCTPDNNSVQHSYNFEFMDKILSEIENSEERETLQEVIMEMKLNPTPELERIRRQACTPINKRIPTPKGIPEFCTTPEFQKRMADDFEKRWRLPTKKIKPDTPIDVVRRRVLKATCRALGVAYMLDDDDDVDGKHKAPKGRRNGETPVRKLTTSRSPLKTCENKSPARAGNLQNLLTDNNEVKALLEQRKSQDDQIVVPNTQSPQTSNLEASTAGELKNLPAIVEGSTLNFDNINFDETFSNSSNKNNQQNNKGAEVSTAINRSIELQQITEYLQSCEKRRQSLKRLHDKNEEDHDRNSTSSNVSHSGSSSLLKNGGEGKNAKKHLLHMFESERFGNDVMVGWNDPCDFKNVERNAREPLDSCQQQPDPSSPKKKPRFSISCAEETLRKEIMFKILQLGGEICENFQAFDASCTHIVCERPNRGQKILGCMSSGKWVLSLKYIDESFSSERFVDEELYEWGNPKALNLPPLTGDEQTIAQAAYHWRQKIAQNRDSCRGAFSGISAILHLGERNKEAFRNVLTAGDGTVMDVTPPFSSNASLTGATHCFVDVKKCSLNRSDHVLLKQNGVLVLSQMYINAYLMNVSQVDIDKYAVKM